MAEIHRPELQRMNGEIGSKRQRRPSVRLGDLGGNLPCESHSRRPTTKQWRPPNLPGNKSSRTRNVLHLDAETLDGNDNLESFAIGSWKTRDSKKRAAAAAAAAKKVRTNWVSKATTDEPDSYKYSAGQYLVDDGGDDDDAGYRGFDMENSDSPSKEQATENSSENLAADNERDSLPYRRPSAQVRSWTRDNHHDGSDTDTRDRNGRLGEDGVKIWLNGLGLGRYAPVFEVHEVDDEVLPLLTLEDLKDMGINAVGSRRKMYCAIQKLGKGFS